MAEFLQRATPVFDEAVKQFRSFLKKQGVGDDIRWIWREDILTRRLLSWRRNWRLPIVIDFSMRNDESLVRRRYQTGVSRGIGLALCAYCVCSGTPCCYVDLPSDEQDAAARLIGPLTFKLNTSAQREAIAQRNSVWLMWSRVTSGNSKDRWLNEIPRRSDALGD